MQQLAFSSDGLLALFVLGQVLYALTFLVDIYFFTRPVNRVRVWDASKVPERDYPQIVLFYPVLRESRETMRTTLLALQRVKYPAGKAHILAIPNFDDEETIASLRDLATEFPFLEILPVPSTRDPTWNCVWRAWDANPKAYWWHSGQRAADRALPPKKTRQLIYAFYRMVEAAGGRPDFLVNYIDADSCPPEDHFLAAVAGMQSYDVLQSQNVAGNLNASLAASWHAFDHMAWDGMKYPHLSADGHHPYWMLGKGLFFRASDLVELGGFHPWITIEDPEVGMRFWANGKKLGIIENPLIEEVPLTFARGVTQRKRWVCGFLQSLGRPLSALKMKPMDRIRAWFNVLPCFTLWINVVGFPTGAWVLWSWAFAGLQLPVWLTVLSSLNVAALVVSLAALYLNTWKRTATVLATRRERLVYMLRINPLFIAIWWLIWLIPLALGLWMYVRDAGRVWERTEKTNANKLLIENLPVRLVAGEAQG